MSRRSRSRSRPPRSRQAEHGAHHESRCEGRPGRHLGQGCPVVSDQRPAVCDQRPAGCDRRLVASRCRRRRLEAPRYEVVINEDQGNFKFASADLPEAARARIDEMVAQLKADPRGNFVEIEGHTDSSGDKLVNQRIGEAARRSGEALSLRGTSGPAAQDERHQLRRRQAGQPEQHPRGPRAESARRHPHSCVVTTHVVRVDRVCLSKTRPRVPPHPQVAPAVPDADAPGPPVIS